METKILTYSERGLVYSFFFDLYTLKEPDVVKEVINTIEPIKDGKAPNIPDKINTCEILIEQSFHDFGKSDAILIIKNHNQKVCLYFEAKREPKWDIHQECKKLKHDFKTKRDFKNGNSKKWPNVSSNLFVQLLYKQILTEKAQKVSNNNLICHDFGLMLNKRKRGNSDHPPIVNRCIGNNPCILRAVDIIKTDPKSNFFVCILPRLKNINNVQDAFEKARKLEGMEDLDLNRIGILFVEDMDNIANRYEFKAYSYFKHHNKNS